MTDELKFGMDKAPSLLKWLTDLDNNPKSHTETWCDGWNAATNNLSQENANLTAKLKLAVEALERLGDCDWVITLPDRMDAVRAIARDALAKIGEQRGRNGHKMHCSKGEGSVTDCHICSPIGEQR